MRVSASRCRWVRRIAALLLFLGAGGLRAQIVLDAALDGAQEVPPVATAGSGEATLILSEDATTLRVKLSFQDLSGNQTVAHIHGPGLPGTPANIVLNLSLALGQPAGSLDRTYTLADFPDFSVDDLKAGFYYLNVHSTFEPAGEIRGQIEGNVGLDGAQEVPPVTTDGTGSATVTLSPAETTLEVHLSFQNLTGNQTVAHIHGPAAPGAGAGIVLDLGLMTGATSGRLDQTYTLADFPLFSVDDFKNNLTYVNIHSDFKTGGEIRGQIIYCGEPVVVTVGDETILDEQLFLACDEVQVEGTVMIMGPDGHGIFSAVNRVSFANGFGVGIDGRMTAATGFPLFPCR